MLILQITEQIKNEQDDQDEAESPSAASVAAIGITAPAAKQHDDQDDEKECHEQKLTITGGKARSDFVKSQTWHSGCG
jgi:hypothetical protein